MAIGAGRRPALRTVATRSGPQTQLGTGLLASRFLPLPDRFGRSVGVLQTHGRVSGSLRARSPHGLQQPFFFLVRPTPALPLDRAQPTDLLIDGHQLLAESLKAVKLVDFLLGLTQGGRIGKGFGHRLASHSPSEAELGIVAGIVRFGAMAGRLATAPDGGGDGAGAQIAQTKKLFQDAGALGLEHREIVWHMASNVRAFYAARTYTFRIMAQKKEKRHSQLSGRAPILHASRGSIQQYAGEAKAKRTPEGTA